MRAFGHICLLTVTLPLTFVGCGGPPPLQWETLDHYDFNVVEADPSLRISAGQLYEWLYFSRAAAAGGRVSDSVIQFVRDSVLIDTLIGLTTADFDLRSHWYEYRGYRERVYGRLRQRFWDHQVADKITLDSQSVVDYYNSHLGQFTIPEQAEMFHILSSPLGFRQGPDSTLVAHYTRDDLEVFAGDYIYRLHQLLKLGEAFENVARDYSHDVESREQGGRLGWIKPGTYIDPFDSVAFSLENGEFSEPYQDGDGWHLLYRTNYYGGGPQPLDSAWVWDGASQAAFDAKADEAAAVVLDSLRRQASIRINDLLLTDTVVYLVADSAWAAIVNETDTIDFRALKQLEDKYRRGFKVGNTTPDIRRIMVNHAAGPVMAMQAARSLGLDTLPDQVAVNQRLWHETARTLKLGALYGDDGWEPTDSAVADYYQEHWSEFHPENHIRARQLIVDEEELAHFLREQAAGGMELDYLAEYYGPEGEGYNIKYEDMGIVEKNRVDSVLFRALVKTHRYQMAPVVKTRRGYHIARVIDRKYERPLQMARGDIRLRLVTRHRQQRWQDYRDRLFQQHRVRFPGTLPPFDLPRLAERNHPRTLP